MNCFAARKYSKNDIRAVLSFGDGQPELVGKVLLTYYMDESKIDKLVKIGQINGIPTVLSKNPGKSSVQYRFSSEKELMIAAKEKNAGYVYLYKKPFWGKADWYLYDPYRSDYNSGALREHPYYKPDLKRRKEFNDEWRKYMGK